MEKESIFVIFQQGSPIAAFEGHICDEGVWGKHQLLNWYSEMYAIERKGLSMEIIHKIPAPIPPKDQRSPVKRID